MDRTRLVMLVMILSFGILVGGCSFGKKNKPITYETIDFTGDFGFLIDWDDIPSTELTAFYPGQASWQFLVSDTHPGADGLLEGTGCLTCHADQEQKLGERLVGLGSLEVNPIEGKPPVKDLNLQAAFNDEDFFIKLEWESERPGIAHTLWRFDGNEWQRFGGPKPNANVEGNRPSYEDRVTMLLTDKNIPAFDDADVGFEEVGCFMTCHNSMREMPKEPSQEEVQAHPFLGEDGLDRSDIRKYLLITRTELNEAGGWDKVKPRQELDRLMADGMFLDLWQFRGARSAPIQFAGDDFVFEYRNSDEGKQPFSNQKQVESMYDKSVTGFNAIPENKFEEMLEDFPMIQGVNTAPIDPDVEFKEGDLLPFTVLREPEGSSGDVEAFSKWEDGKWTVVMKRALDTGNPDDKVLAEGNVYTVGFGVFDDHVSNRRHFVTFPRTLGLGVDADLRAEKIE